MKTYRSITNQSQVDIDDRLVTFYDNEVWHTFKVYEKTENGIGLICPSRAIIFVSNDRLAQEKEYFKRV